MVGYIPRITTETTVEDLRFEAYICVYSACPGGLKCRGFLLTSAGMAFKRRNLLSVAFRPQSTSPGWATCN